MSTAQPFQSRKNTQSTTGVVAKFRVDARRGSEYHIEVVEDLAATFAKLCSALGGRQSLVLTSPTVSRLYRNELEAAFSGRPNISMASFAVEESSKTIERASRICSLAKKHALDRKGTLVAVGGGVLMDVVSSAAAIYRRGISHFRVPTTLIGQIDAGIGVKGSLNLEGKKSQLGCFHPPDSVFICPQFLGTLATPHLRGGLAEMIKIAIIRGPQLFQLLEDSAPELIRSKFQSTKISLDSICAACDHMLEELTPNLFEDSSYERHVDFGHTFSPMIESESRFAVSHGDAVAIDIAFSAAVSRNLRLINQDSYDRILRLLHSSHLPIWHESLTIENCLRALENASRHRGGCANLVVPTSIGSTDFLRRNTDIPRDVIASSIEHACQQAAAFHSRSAKTNHRDTKTAPVHVVLDIGGTSIRSALFNCGSGTIDSHTHSATPNHLDNPEMSLEELASLLRDAVQSTVAKSLDGSEPDLVTIAFAGPIDSNGHLAAAPTIWGTKLKAPFNILEYFRTLWPNADIDVLNDVAAAGYRFLRHDDDSLVVITIGSGIGNKTFVNGVPWTGPNGRGGEIGHICVDDAETAPVCECGGRGHLGSISSGRGTLNLAKRTATDHPQSFADSIVSSLCCDNIDDLTNDNLVEAFHQHDTWTVNAIQTSVQPLGRVISTIHLNLGIERFVIYGGFGLALGEEYRRLIVKAAAENSWNVGQDWNKMIQFGPQDGDSGLIGAGRSRRFPRQV